MQKERAEKSLLKLEARLKEISPLGLDSKYPEVFALASQYAQDSRHYLEKGDSFSSFGCSDYSYGLLDALLIIEGKKGDFPE